MKIYELIKEIKGTFKLPVKKYYFGKLAYGTPYFYPLGFNKNIISIRILKLKDPDKYADYVKKYPHLKDLPQAKFSNYPMFGRSKKWVFKLFGKNIWLEIGWPFAIRLVELGWKYKYDDIRFEWLPSFQIDVFHWQFFMWWQSPDIDGKCNDDKYYEMILWWLKKCNKDIKKAKETWGWVDYKTKISSWDDRYLI